MLKYKNNDGEWLPVPPPIDMIPNEVTYGSNSNGEYLKFDNGILICWQSKHIQLSIQDEYGTLFTGDWSWNFPHKFIEAPTVPAPSVKHGSSASWGTVGSVPTITQAKYRAVDVLSRKAENTYISMFAIGRWK